MLSDIKQECHTYISLLDKENLLSRQDSYLYLSRKLGIDVEDCHIGNLNEKRATKAASALKRHYRKLTIRKNRQDTKNEQDNRRPAPSPTKRHVNSRRRAQCRRRAERQKQSRRP